LQTWDSTTPPATSWSPPTGRSPPPYRVTGSEPVLDGNALSTDDPVATEPSDLPLPPEALTFTATTTAGRSPGLGQFLGLYQAITSTGGFSYDNSQQARGGHGVRQIADLVKTKRGTSEQYASMFALLSRHLGWDARVVLGFRPTWDGDRLRIQGTNVFAWTEVRFQRLGWITVNPSPTQTTDEQGKLAQQPKPADDIQNIPPPDQPIPQEPPDDASAPETDTRRRGQPGKRHPHPDRDRRRRPNPLPRANPADRHPAAKACPHPGTPPAPHHRRLARHGRSLTQRRNRRQPPLHHRPGDRPHRRSSPILPPPPSPTSSTTRPTPPTKPPTTAQTSPGNAPTPFAPNCAKT
jgi:hypothetical protein